LEEWYEDETLDDGAMVYEVKRSYRPVVVRKIKLEEVK